MRHYISALSLLAVVLTSTALAGPQQSAKGRSAAKAVSCVAKCAASCQGQLDCTSTKCKQCCATAAANVDRATQTTRQNGSTAKLRPAANRSGAKVTGTSGACGNCCVDCRGQGCRCKCETLGKGQQLTRAETGRKL